MQLSSFVFLIFGAMSAASGQILLKLRADGRTNFLSFSNFCIVSGPMLYALGAAFRIFVLSKEPLTIVYPFTILTFVLVYIGGIFLLGEAPSVIGVVGVVTILLGQFLVFLSSGTP
jgi:multidrug transporter EmrE-like cation transporter